MHMDRTEISVGETATVSLTIANAVNKPPITAQLLLTVPSGWSVEGRGFDNQCSGQCSAVYSVPTDEQESIKVFVRPNETGPYRLEGTTQWFLKGDESNVRVETEVMSVNGHPGNDQRRRAWFG